MKFAQLGRNWYFRGIFFAALVLGLVAYGYFESRDTADVSAFTYDEMSGPAREPVSPELKRQFTSVMRKIEGLDNLIPIEFYREQYDVFGPAVMIAALDDDLACHSQAHNLGRVIYERTNDLAMATWQCQNSCNGGCVHGVLMEMFAQRSGADPSQHARIEDLTPEFKKEVADMCTKSEITRYTGIGDCYHAVGHALMVLADYDIPAALELCSLFEPSGRGAVYYCATGLYMERDIALGDVDARTSSVYPCDENMYPAACFRYKLRHVFDLQEEYTQAIDICMELTGANRRGCFHGLGFGAAWRIYDDPSLLNVICGAGDDTDKRMCLEGAFGFTNNYSGSIAKSACERYDAGSREICDAASVMGNFGMHRDFELYMR